MDGGVRTLFLVGRQRFQNELIGFYLRQHCAVETHERDNLGQVPASPDAGPHSRLVFYDCGGEGKQPLLAMLKGEGTDLLGTSVLALYNLDRSAGLEREALDLGVRGFFYANEGPEIMVKGIRAMLRGEIWVSRKHLSDGFLGRRERPSVDGGPAAALTRREREILALVATGASNDAIADQLCISRHTVKAHIYKIFKKIQVPNRLQASFWAAKYL